MVPIVKKIRAFIFKDVIRENEVKDTAVLLRSLTLFAMLYHLSLLIIFLSHYPLQASGLNLFILCLFVCVFIISYKDKTIFCLYAYSIISVFDATTRTLYFGKLFSFHFILFFTILLLFFRTEGPLKLKYFSAFFIGLIVFLLTILPAGYRISNFDLTSLYPYIIFLNSFYITIALITIARFYCLKFAASETKIMQYSRKLELLASVDTLTGLQNRRSMLDYLEKLEKNYIKSDISFSIAIADIDFFKNVNDTYGHDTGDYVLTKLSNILQDFMSDKGFVARWGGEEFLFAFNGSNADDIFVDLSKLKNIIQNEDFQYKNNHLAITLTFGLEEYDSTAGLEATIRNADQKLYLGKERGRNCVIY